MSTIKVPRGRTGQVIFSVIGMTDWTDIIAKMYVTNRTDGTVIYTLTGSTIPETNKAVFPYNFSDSSTMASGTYSFEAVLYRADKSFVKTIDSGIFIVKSSQKTDPTA